MTLFDADFCSQVCDRSRGGGGVGCFLESLLKAVKTNRDESLMPNSTDLETIGLGDVLSKITGAKPKEHEIWKKTCWAGTASLLACYSACAKR